jgi:putative PIN family toxin of toxin-antitoxin system
MRVVSDTNVIISALLFDGLPEHLVLSTLLGPNQLVLSPYIITETIRILESKFSVSPAGLNLLQQILGEAEVIYFQPSLSIISDEPDNRILETAVNGGARYLVTGDKLLLKLQKYKTVQMVSVKKYLEIIEGF